MPQKKRMPNGKMSRNFYMDFIINGVRVNKSCRTDDIEHAFYAEEAAKQELKDSMAERLDRTLMGETPETVTLSDALEFTYSERWSKNKAGHKPKQQVERVIDLLGDPLLADLMDQKNADKPTGIALFRQLREKLAAEDLQDQTIDSYLTAVKTLLHVNRDERPMPDLRVPKIPMANVNRTRERILYMDEEDTFFKLAEVGDPDHADFWKVLLDTGMRTSECLSLDFRRNVRFREGIIHLFKDQVKGSRQQAKGRSVIMTKRVTKILQRIHRTRTGRVWPAEWNATSTGQCFRKYRIEMGLAEDQDFVQHMFRHTCCTRLLEGGVDFGLVQSWMGHSTAEMTRRYAKYTVEMQRNSAAVLDALQTKYRDKVS